MWTTYDESKASAVAGTLRLYVWHVGGAKDEDGGVRKRYGYRLSDDNLNTIGHEANDLYSGVGAEVDPRHALTTLVAFLTAAGEAYRSTMGDPDQQAENETLFPGWVNTAIRTAGGLYLLYLAGRLVLPTFRADPGPDLGIAAPRHGDRSAFGQALFTNLLNPKAVLFFAAVLPQFVGGPAPTWAQVSILGALDVLLGLVAWSVVILAGARLGRLLSRDRVRRWWDRTIGATLGVLGGGLFLARD